MCVITNVWVLFQGKGRVLLLMFALFLAMNHPLRNVQRNLNVMSQSTTCGQEMALNQTKDLVKAAVAPMQGGYFCQQLHYFFYFFIFRMSIKTSLIIQLKFKQVHVYIHIH